MKSKGLETTQLCTLKYKNCIFLKEKRYTKQDGNCLSYGIENYIFSTVKEILPVRPKITFFPTLDVKVFRGERSKKLPPFLSFRGTEKKPGKVTRWWNFSIIEYPVSYFGLDFLVSTWSRTFCSTFPGTHQKMESNQKITSFGTFISKCTFWYFDSLKSICESRPR